MIRPASLALALMAASAVAAPAFKPRTFQALGVAFKMMPIKMIPIPAGSFLMGSPATEEGRGKSEEPRRVTITRAFYLSETEVTQELYESVTLKNPSKFLGPKKPVEQVSWNEAVAFCARLTELTGSEFRLPTEAEWEYACRAGTTTPFHYGPDLDSDMANFDGAYPYGDGTRSISRQKTLNVKTFRRNPWGLFDMHGNVSEWCLDFFGDYLEEDVTDPAGPESGDHRVIRGGSWFSSGAGCRSAFRRGDRADYRSANVGFRIAGGMGG